MAELDISSQVLIIIQKLYHDYERGIQLDSVLSVLPHFDSLRVLELVLVLEEEFDVWVEMEDIEGDWTVSDLIALVEKGGEL